MKSVHTKIKNNICKQCDSAFSTTNMLDHHVKAIHDKIKGCPHDKYSCSQSSALAMHIKAVHNKIKDNICQHCDKVFSQSSALATHIEAVHDKIKNERCPHCNYSSQMISIHAVRAVPWLCT